MPLELFVLFLAALWAGTQNAIAGGGSFVTLPALIFSGLDPRIANITSTVALFPGQAATGWFGRRSVDGAGRLSFTTIAGISVAGGALGAFLLLATPSSFFSRLLPWLVLFATGVFAWGSFFRKAGANKGALGPLGTGLTQFGIAIYGGYFGGGIGFLMLAVLTMSGHSMRTAGASKNVLASAMNASAVLVFALTTHLDWLKVGVVAAGAIFGGLAGGWLLKRVNERMLRALVVLIGLALTVGLFCRGALSAQDLAGG